MSPKTPRTSRLLAVAAFLTTVTFHPTARAQPRQQGPQVVSPHVVADGRVTFRVHAPKAESIQLGGSGDISGTGFGQSSLLLEGDNGVWEITVGPLRPGAYLVMPNGHAGPFSFGGGGGSMFGEFEAEFVADIQPLVEKRYRVYTDRAHRAIAGLSMGGAHTLNLGIPHLDQFAYLGVYSSGIFGITGGFGGNQPQGPGFEEQHQAILDDPNLKEGLNLFWFATGKDDFLIETSKATVEMFRKHKFDVVYRETDGGHTWDNWRDYLHEFAPPLFQ